MKQRVETLVQTVGGGLVTLPNLLSLPVGATPACMDVKFSVGDLIEKRLGSNSINSVALTNTSATGFSPDAGNSLSTSLQAYWKLNEEGGTRVDSFGSNNLSPAGAIGFAAGVLGNAAAGNTANVTFLSVSDNTVLSFGSVNWTVAGWVYRLSTADTPIAGQRGVGQQAWSVESATSSGTAGIYLLTLFNTSGTSTNVWANTFGVATTNTWTFLAFGLDSANARAWIQVNNYGTNGAVHAGDIGASNALVVVGGYGNPPVTGDDSCNGRVDEWGVWKKYLVPQERADLYNGGAANTYNAGVAKAGWGSFDFGAGATLRWHIVAAGTGIYASSNRGVAYLTIATDRLANYQEFERSKSFLIAVSATHNKVLYWAGSVGTSMLGMPAGSAPAAQHALDFNGWLLLMNNSGGNKRMVYYADNATFTTDPWTKTFEVASSADDEITGGIAYNTRAYVFTRYTTHQVSPVGGNPDFSVRQVKNWGAVPRTIKRVTYKDVGEVIVCLGWDKKVRIFDGSDEQIISTPIEQPNNLSAVYLDGIETTALQKCHAEVDTTEQVYRLWIVMTPSTEVTHSINLNLRTGAWYPYREPNLTSAVMAESDNSRALLFVKQDGFVYQANTGYTDQGTAISEFYASRHVLGPSGSTVTKRQQASLYFAPTSSGTLYYQEAFDFARTFAAARDTVTLTGASGVTVVKKTVDLPTTDNVYQFQLSSSGSTAAPWRLARVELSGAPLGQGAA